VSIVVDIAQKIKLSKDSLSETSLINHPKKICKKIEPFNSTSFQNFILKCNTASVVLSIQESSRSDQPLTEDQDFHLKEFKEIQQEKLLEKTLNDLI